MTVGPQLHKGCPSPGWWHFFFSPFSPCAATLFLFVISTTPTAQWTFYLQLSYLMMKNQVLSQIIHDVQGLLGLTTVTEIGRAWWMMLVWQHPLHMNAKKQQMKGLLHQFWYEPLTWSSSLANNSVGWFQYKAPEGTRAQSSTEAVWFSSQIPKAPGKPSMGAGEASGNKNGALASNSKMWFWVQNLSWPARSLGNPFMRAPVLQGVQWQVEKSGENMSHLQESYYRVFGVSSICRMNGSFFFFVRVYLWFTGF